MERNDDLPLMKTFNENHAINTFDDNHTFDEDHIKDFSIQLLLGIYSSNMGIM